ncbi:MAG: hypothetical protein CM15mP89_2440 [Gammaproteobacteria bacterium]|nr:MAG: hypothetical protein CM15mP89_2440 [Gammaproteobacteria bacterium]
MVAKKAGLRGRLKRSGFWGPFYPRDEGQLYNGVCRVFTWIWN